MFDEPFVWPSQHLAQEIAEQSSKAATMLVTFFSQTDYTFGAPNIRLFKNNQNTFWQKTVYYFCIDVQKAYYCTAKIFNTADKGQKPEGLIIF